MPQHARYARYLTLSIALLALAISISSARRPEDIVALATRVIPPVVAIECQLAPNRTNPLRVCTKSRGSGVIVDPSGLVVTNFHVVRTAVSIKVTLHNGMSVPATLVGKDANADLAVLRLVGVSNLPYLRIGRAEELSVGQRVIAIGNAYGFGAGGEPSLTAGVVSGKHRRVMGQKWYEMDAQIYPGNSGGPVCDMLGEVVGISVAISSHLKPFFVPLDRDRRAVLRDISGGLIDPPA